MMDSYRIPLLARESIEAQIDRLFDDAIRNSSGQQPHCDVYEDEKSFCVQMAVPGLSVNEIHVELNDDTLRVSGERKSEPSEGRTWHLRELQEGSFTCAFHLPLHVSPDGVHASYELGILTITVPKREAAQSRRILIESSDEPLIQDKKRGILKRSRISAILVFAGLIGLGTWSAWGTLLGS